MFHGRLFDMLNFRLYSLWRSSARVNTKTVAGTPPLSWFFILVSNFCTQQGNLLGGLPVSDISKV